MQERIRSISTSKTYKRIFLSMIGLLTVIVLAVSCIFYCTFLLRQREEIDQDMQRRLAQSEEQINQSLNELLRIVLAIERNSKGVFRYAPLVTQEQKSAILEELQYYAGSSGFIRDISYYSLLDEDIIYSTQGIFDLNGFQEYVYAGTESVDSYFQHLENTIFFTIAADQIVAKCEPYRVMALVYGLPFMEMKPQRFVTFYIDKSYIDNIFCDFLQNTENVWIFEDGAMIYSMNGSDIVDDADCVTYRYTSPNTLYSYLTVAQKSVIYEPYYRNLTFFFSLLGIVLLIILLSSSMVALYNFNPLYRLVRKFDVHLYGNAIRLDEVALLDMFVEKTLADKQRISRRLFVTNTIWEQYETAAELDSAAQEANIVFEYPQYTCCCVRYCSPLDGHVLCGQFENALNTVQSLAVAAKQSGQERISILVNHAENSRVMLLLQEAIESLAPHELQAGVSEASEDVLHLSPFYDEALRAMQYAVQQRWTCAEFSQLPQEAANPEAPAESAQDGTADKDLKRRILQCIQDNLQDSSLSLESIAGKCGISASYLVRYFKSCMGITPMLYVDTLRMDIAKRLLATTGYTLREIVGRCGYLDTSNFARKFKKQEGMTPMNYRREHCQEVEESVCKN